MWSSLQWTEWKARDSVAGAGKEWQTRVSNKSARGALEWGEALTVICREVDWRTAADQGALHAEDWGQHNAQVF